MTDESNGVPIRNGRRSSSRTNGRTSGQYGPIYRRDSNISSTSFLDDVEMAHDEVFGGPMAESVPTSVSSFVHRRGRADSTASFTYYQEDEEEIKAGEEEEEQDEAGSADKMEETTSSDVKGIPEFWLSAMKNQISLAEMITDRDEAALKDLTDVRMEYLDKPGFRLIFEFAENEFFTNKAITKTYFYQNESGYGGDFIYDHAEGDKIDEQNSVRGKVASIPSLIVPTPGCWA